MIGEKTAKLMMACGWIAAAASGLLTAVLAYSGTGGLNPLNLTDAGILLGLAYGIYRKSRVCALAALIYYVINQVMRLKMMHAPTPIVSLLPPIAIFASAYVLGVIGTIARHSRDSVGWRG